MSLGGPVPWVASLPESVHFNFHRLQRPTWRPKSNVSLFAKPGVAKSRCWAKRPIPVVGKAGASPAKDSKSP
eukprot:8370930-Prorocentrum_lima.AAC.1